VRPMKCGNQNACSQPYLIESIFSKSGELMNRPKFKPSLPGRIATGLLIVTTSFWTFWGVAEMYYEGWGLPFPEPLAYLIPGAVCLALTLAALTWPRFGGWLLILIGGGFTAWWWTMTARRGMLTLGGLLSTLSAGCWSAPAHFFFSRAATGGAGAPRDGGRRNSGSAAICVTCWPSDSRCWW